MLIIEKCRPLLSGRAPGLAKEEAAIEHDGALGDPAFEPSPDGLCLPETRTVVEQSFVAVKLLAKNMTRLVMNTIFLKFLQKRGNPWPFYYCIVPRPSLQLILSEPLASRAVLRRASTDSRAKNPVSKNTMGSYI